MTEDGDFVNEIFGEVGTTKLGLGNPPRQWGLEELSMETTDVVVRTHPETGEPVAHDTRYGRDDYNRIHREDVGAHAKHPQLCGRCVSNVDGDGETRVWF